MICTILILNLETNEIDSVVIKNDNVYPNEALIQINKLVTNINEKSKSNIVLSVNIILVDILENKIKNKLDIKLKD